MAGKAALLLYGKVSRCYRWTSTAAKIGSKTIAVDDAIMKAIVPEKVVDRSQTKNANEEELVHYNEEASLRHRTSSAQTSNNSFRWHRGSLVEHAKRITVMFAIAINGALSFEAVARVEHLNEERVPEVVHIHSNER